MAQEGQKVGHYRLISVLGRGGMGEVYRAEDLQLSRQVAIKVIHVEGAMRQGAVQDALRLFKREAQAIASLQHPHILPLYEYGEEPINTAILTYMVMPICAEGSLVDWLDKYRSMPLAPIEVAHFLKQAAEALQEAHDHNIIHQDIKPANFLIRPRKGTTLPDLLLADFGVAKLTSATASMSQSVRGTPYYMAPEQWKGKPLPATDQYALGVMAYELLTGQLPFQGSTETLMYQHIFEPPTPLNQINARISPTLSNVVLRAMAKEPADRFPSVLDFAHAFELALQSKANGAAPKAPAASPTGRNSNTVPPAPPPKVTKPEPYPQQMVTPTPGYSPAMKSRRNTIAFAVTVFAGITILACLIILFHSPFTLGFLIIDVLIGLITGLLASVLLRGGGYGLIGYIGIGILGSLIGGFLGSFLLGGIIDSFIGSCVLIAILRLLSSRRRGA